MIIVTVTTIQTFIMRVKTILDMSAWMMVVVAIVKIIFRKMIRNIVDQYGDSNINNQSRNHRNQVDYESMYTQDNHHYRREDTHERYDRQPQHDEAYRRNQEKPHHSDRESRTTDLFKQLSNESNDPRYVI